MRRENTAINIEMFQIKSVVKNIKVPEVSGRLETPPGSCSFPDEYSAVDDFAIKTVVLFKITFPGNSTIKI